MPKRDREGRTESREKPKAGKDDRATAKNAASSAAYPSPRPRPAAEQASSVRLAYGPSLAEG